MQDILPHSTPKESVAAIISTPLSDDRGQSLEAFKAKLRNEGLYQPASDDTAASHDDITLLRFLRARRYDVDKAQKQFSDTEAWRKHHNVDELFRTFETNEMESARRFYPRWTGRRDKTGLPVYVYRLASLDAPLRKELESVPSERRYQRIIALYESMTRFVLPLCSHLAAPTPVSSVTTIIDLEQVSLSAMWSLRSHLQVASTMATANYPETLSTIAIVNSPSFFPTIWNWIKTWFDEGTRNKIHILGKDPGRTLRLLIDERDLPQSYGGQLPWKFEDEPDLDDTIKKLIGEMPKGPVLFVDGSTVKLLG
ncbi:CRAL/TRIO domain-containing protein [Suillus subaureus]|uniref:CRAL/TRIO domain-containing protein n=1 Tax=Suillus subaureus TaxID=48587 RepID=A0A9P7JGY7_9AGAM|nr:CRAL/TRIO domain-containing protein [Suillus subaureus]KAG1822610.1 CRAL/TRIO domain-containing protein [Suillus subaureus]